MAIRFAAQIHRLRRDPLPPTFVATEIEYRRAHAAAIRTISGTVTISADHPPVHVEGWKWCVTCTTIDCSNRPMFGWDIACCFDCGAVYEGLALPDDAAEIERLLSFRPLAKRTWLETQTLDDLRAQNLEMGVPT